MIDTLKIGEYIYDALSQDSSVNGYRVYPLVADNNAKFPFVIYRRAGLESSTCKDGTYEDSVTMEVMVVSDKYSTGIDIAVRIREILEKQYAIFNTMEINDGNMVLATEEYSDNAYIQRMQFNFKINRN